MHMNSAPHLLNEDREEFRRALDEALRAAADRPDLAATGMRLNTEQLRTMALSATTAIAACATAEYQHYVSLRAELRSPASARPATAGTESGEGGDGAGGTGVGIAAMGEVAEATGAGLAAMVTVLAPVLAGIAAILFLLIGYALHTVNPDEALAQPLISVGWAFAGLTAAAILIAMGGLLVTALRNGSTSLRASRPSELAQEVERARQKWREALLERGLRPFLLEALTAPDPPTDPRPDSAAEKPAAPPRSAPPTGPASAPDHSTGTSPTSHPRDPAAPGAPAGETADGDSDRNPPTPSSSAAPEAAGRFVVHRTSDAGRMPTLGYTHPRFSGPENDHRAAVRPHFTSPDFTSPDYGGPDHQPE
ncbi:hypothetical protein [Streptomyces olivaceiscleroticus]|uniref:Membrane protein n=1 Tax=Streptomyces olivaceiscleroticus TaxID=68245 RepID=A0ABP3K221_9ACTN